MSLLLAPLAIPAQFALAVVAAAIAPRRVAVALLGVVAALPWAIPGELVPLRGVAALVAIALFMRGVDLLRESPPRPLAARVAHALSLADLRLARAVPPAIPARLVVVGVALLAAGLLVLWGAAEAVTSAGRWGLGVAGFYVLFEAVDRFVQAGYRAIGLEIGPAQRTPLAARTVAEFWGRRWNAIVHRWLASVAFFPLARRGHVALAGLAAFALSAAIHTYLVIPGVGLAAGLRMGAFFVVQGLLVVIERALGIARAPAWVGHAWTVACFVATVPLFIEPFLRLAGFPPLP